MDEIDGAIKSAEEIKQFIQKLNEATKGIDAILLSLWAQYKGESIAKELAEKKTLQLEQEILALSREVKEIKRENATLRRKATSANSDKLSIHNKMQKIAKELTQEKIKVVMLKELLVMVMQHAIDNGDKDILELLRSHNHNLDEETIDNETKIAPDGLPTFSEHYQKEIVYHDVFLENFDSLNSNLKKATLIAIKQLADEGSSYNSLITKILDRPTKNSGPSPSCSRINSKWRFIWENNGDGNILITEILNRNDAYKKINVA